MAFLAGLRGDRSLQTTLAGVGGATALLVVGVAAFLSWSISKSYLEADADRRLSGAAERTSALVGQYMKDRRAELELLASLPQVVAAAEAGARQSARLRLPSVFIAPEQLGHLPRATQAMIDQLERRFNAARSLDVDPGLATFLRDVDARSDFAELFLTESHGYNAAIGARTSDFVTVTGAGGDGRLATARVAGTRWWVLVRQGTSRAYGAVRAIGRLILVTAIVLVALVFGVFSALAAWLNRRVTRPVANLAAQASAVAQ